MLFRFQPYDDISSRAARWPEFEWQASIPCLEHSHQLITGFRYKFVEPEHVIDHVIIGGGLLLVSGLGYKAEIITIHVGVIGLAIAARLTKSRPNKATFVLERHTRVGEETRHVLLPRSI